MSTLTLKSWLKFLVNHNLPNHSYGGSEIDSCLLFFHVNSCEHTRLARYDSPIRITARTSPKIVCFHFMSACYKLPSGLKLAWLEIKGGFSLIRLDLPAPSGVVPIQISGGASEIEVRRPAGVAARGRFKGWVSELMFDEQIFSGVGNNARLQSSDFDPTAPCYDIEVTSYANRVTITSG